MPSMRVALAGMALLLTVAACATTPKDPMERLSVEQLQQMGESYLAAGDIAKALKFLTMAHERSPNDPMILYELGLAYDERGLQDQAMAQYEQALKIKPDFSDVHNAMGRLYASRGQLDKARASFEQAFNNPFYGMPYISLYNLGLVYEKQNDLPSALRQYEEAVRLQPAYGIAHYRMGLVLETMGRTDEARRAYGKAARYSPNMPEAHLRYGVLSYNSGDIQNALYSLNRVVKLSPHTDMEEEARRYLAQLQSIVGPGSLRGGYGGEPGRLAEMEIVSSQELNHMNRSLKPPPLPKMPPPPKTLSSVSGMSPTGLSRELPPSPPSMDGTKVSREMPASLPTRGPQPAAGKGEPPLTGSGKTLPAPPETEAALKQGTTEIGQPPPMPEGKAAETKERESSSLPGDAFSTSEGSSPAPTEGSPQEPSQLVSSQEGDTTKGSSTDSSRRRRWAYIVQVGSFLERDNAESVRQRLEKKGYSAVVKPFSHQTRGNIYVVQLSPVEDSAEASSLLNRIESEEKLKPLVIKIPSGDQP